MVARHSGGGSRCAGIGPTVRRARELYATSAAASRAKPAARYPRLTVGPVADTTVRITWQTDEPADAAVHFGPGLASQVGVLGLATEYAILVTGLDPANTYAFEALSRDASGNVGAGSWTTTSPRGLGS